jgi:murein DD-endopeptidase MepM/ murein hydrolase activator NlpD
MARQLRVAAIIACAAVVFAAQAAALPGQDRTTIVTTTSAATRASAAAFALERVTSRTSASAVVLGDVEIGTKSLDRELPPLEAGDRSDSVTLETLRAQLTRQAQIAAEQVTAWKPPKGIVTLEELRAPLEAVTAALNAGERYEMALVEHLEQIGRSRNELERLQAEAAAHHFLIQTQLADLRMQLADAARADAGSPGSGRQLVRQIEGLAGRAQTMELALRRDQAQLVVLAGSLADQEASVREGMKFAQRTRDELYQQMIRAENAISTMVPSLFAGAAYVGPIDTKGVLQVCPVDPPNAYSDDFGAPRYAGGYHPHQGNDIFAPEGTPIRAPFPGNAVVTSNTLGGNAVTVYGALGYVYNAHLSRFGTLGPVEAGEIIGYVGHTGDAIHSPPHDHFEWHPDNGPAVDPFVHLNAVCRPASTTG